MPGLFLTFEGVEGSGKSSRCRDLLEALRLRRCETVFTREPGGPDISERIRGLLLDPGLTVPPLTELMLYFAGRAANVDLVVSPALSRGAVVVCDRYGDATMAYQGYGRGLPLDGIRTANRLATGGLKPHLTVLMDLDPEEGFRRMSSSGRKLDRIEMEDLAFHRRVRDGYLELASGEPERFLVVDGMLAPGEQNALILGEVIRRGEERKVAGL
ncbi:MAG TPA: dTMP kinase [Candidatus Sabulitectum sp.]|nr:dTMP kinase [Candidatus Sabulitectum sp.]HPJ28659.1 dTMP kinase [Candidatus Sabulitectum sp.]HPR22207.1 dTMP kinase [Candidatus Sabulitectum sp.]